MFLLEKVKFEGNRKSKKKEYEKFRVKQDRKYILSIDEIYKKSIRKRIKMSNALYKDIWKKKIKL